MPAARDHAFRALHPDGEATPATRAVAVEAPVALEVNGLGYAVMMATPADLEDLGHGFVLAERLVERADQILDVYHHETAAGTILRVTVAPERAALVAERVRHRVSESACGLCGVENLEQAIRPLPWLAPSPAPATDAIFAALAALRDHQPLSRATGAVHAAAQVGADGGIVRVREDVGRHNAFDKLVGAMLRAGAGWDGGFALLTSRCSYELVEKAVLAGCPTLVTISAPTTLALERAEAAGLRLIALARSDAVLLA